MSTLTIPARLFVITLLLVICALLTLMLRPWESLRLDGPLAGTVDVRTAQLAFRVDGRLASVFAEDGATIERGDLLASVDDELFREALAVSEAGVRAAEAALAGTKDLDTKAANLDAATATREQWLTRIADSQLRAPSDGFILKRLMEPGSMVVAGEPVYSMALTDKVHVQAFINKDQLSSVEPGTPVKIVTDVSQRQYQGQVSFVSPRAEQRPQALDANIADRAGVHRVRIAVQKPDESLHQDMPVSLTFSNDTN